MLDLVTTIAVAGAFLPAGTVKGVLGLGLPTISLGLLTVSLDLNTAMALMVVPSFVTNIRQAVAGGHGRVLLRRFWPFLLMATVTLGLGATALARLDSSLLSGLLGGLLVAYAWLGLAQIRLVIHRMIISSQLRNCVANVGIEKADHESISMLTVSFFCNEDLLN